RLQIARLHTRMLANAREHARANFLVFMKSENVIGPPNSLQDPMGTPGLTLDTPTDSQQGGENSSRLRRSPLIHGVTAKTPSICGTVSPCSRRSASTRSA